MTNEKSARCLKKKLENVLRELWNSIHSLSDETSSSCQKCFALKCFGRRFLICCDLTLFTVKATVGGKQETGQNERCGSEEGKREEIVLSDAARANICSVGRFPEGNCSAEDVLMGNRANSCFFPSSELPFLLPFPLTMCQFHSFLCIYVQCCIQFCF